MKYFPRRSSDQVLVAVAAAVLLAFSLLPSIVAAQNKPLQVGGLPVT